MYNNWLINGYTEYKNDTVIIVDSDRGSHAGIISENDNNSVQAQCRIINPLSLTEMSSMAL